MMTQDFEQLDIPDFLKVTPAEMKRRREYNATHPPVAQQFSGPRRDVDDIRAKLEADKKAAEAIRLASLNERKKDERAKLQFATKKPGFVWSAEYGRWVHPNFMSPAKYARILSEMPTEAHRKCFEELYGGGVAALAAPAPRKARAAKANVKAAKPRKGKAIKAAPAATKAKGKVAAKAAPAQAKPVAARTGATLEGMLSRPEGVTLAELGAEFGWLLHTAGARISGVRKTKTVVKAAEERGTVYRIKVGA